MHRGVSNSHCSPSTAAPSQTLHMHPQVPICHPPLHLPLRQRTTWPRHRTTAPQSCGTCAHPSPCTRWRVTPTRCCVRHGRAPPCWPPAAPTASCAQRRCPLPLGSEEESAASARPRAAGQVATTRLCGGIAVAGWWRRVPGSRQRLAPPTTYCSTEHCNRVIHKLWAGQEAGWVGRLWVPARRRHAEQAAGREPKGRLPLALAGQSLQSTRCPTPPQRSGLTSSR